MSLTRAVMPDDSVVRTHPTGKGTDMDGVLASGLALSEDMHRHHVGQAVAPIPIRI